MPVNAAPASLFLVENMGVAVCVTPFAEDLLDLFVNILWRATLPTLSCTPPLPSALPRVATWRELLNPGVNGQVISPVDQHVLLLRDTSNMAVECKQLLFHVAGSEQRLRKTFTPQKSGEAWCLIGRVSAEGAVHIMFQLRLDGCSACWKIHTRKSVRPVFIFETGDVLRFAARCVEELQPAKSPGPANIPGARSTSK